MKTAKKHLWLMLLLALVLGIGFVCFYFALTRVDSYKDHARKNLRINEMLALARVEIPQYLTDNPDISPKEFTEYCEEIRNKRGFYINSDLEQWKNPDQNSAIAAIRDCSSVDAGYIKFNGERGQ